MNDEPGHPQVPEEGGGLEEETAPPIEESLQSGSVPIMRSLNDLSAAEEAQASPAVNFAAKPDHPGKPAGVDTAPVSLDAVAQSTDSMRTASGSFDDIINPPSGSYDQLPAASASASGSFDHLRTPSGSYGQMPAAAPPEPANAPPMGFVKRTMITLVVAVVCFVGVVWLCISQWVPSQTALLLMGGGMVLPTLLVGYFTSQRSKRNVVLRIFPALVLGGAGMAGAFMWSQSHVRAMAVPYTPESVKGMKQMLGDPSHEIALAACKRFAKKHGDADWWGPMFELLNGRPKLALDCVSNMPREARTRIGGSLADRWAGELVKGETKSGARACAIAAGVATLPIPPQEAGARLLQCTVETEAPEIQACCGTALAGMVEDEADWAARLPSVMKTAKTPAVKSGVLAMSLHQQGLTEPQKQLAEEIGFGSSVVRHVTLVLACESVTDESSVTVQHLKAALDKHCNLEMDRMPKGPQWAKLCRSSLQQLKADPHSDPIEILCTLTTVKPVAEAIAAARKVVRTAPPIITR